MATASKREKAHKLLKNNEPRINPMNYDHDIMMALQYYNLNHEPKEKRKWVYSRYPKVKFNEDLSDYYFRILGTLIRIEDNGNELSENHKIRMEKEFKLLTTIPVKKDEAVEDSKPKVSIQDKMDEKASEFLGEFAGLIDEFVTTGKAPKVDSLVTSMNIRGPMIKKVLSGIEKPMAELTEVIEGKDKQLVEGYSNFKKPDIKKLLGLYETLVSTLSQAKVLTPRKPRKVKVKPPAVIAKGVKYLSESADFGLKSINPAHVVGQSEVWLFNSKYKKLFCYKAIEGMTLTFKGTSLLNWDQAKSEVKSIRKPETIKGLMDLGTRAWHKFMNEQKSKPGKCNGRINSETLILVSFR